MSNIETRVRKIIETKLGAEEADIKLGSRFVDDLGADSLDTVELIMELEKEFDVSIPDEDAAEITTVGAAIDYLTKKTK